MTLNTIENVQTQLTLLREEHRSLDQQIFTLEENFSANELLVRRLKKQKLILKDRIVMLERQLEPDTYA